MTKIDMLLRDAEPIEKARKEFKLAESRISSRDAAMADLPPDAPGLSDLLKAYQAVTKTALDAADSKDWMACPRRPARLGQSAGYA